MKRGWIERLRRLARAKALAALAAIYLLTGQAIWLNKKDFLDFFKEDDE